MKGADQAPLPLRWLGVTAKGPQGESLHQESEVLDTREDPREEEVRSLCLGEMAEAD